MFKGLFCALSVVVLAACGDSGSGTGDKDKTTTPNDGGSGAPVGGAVDTSGLLAGASLTLGNAVFSADNGSYSWTTFNTCRKELASGFFTLTIGDATGGLDVRIKDFRSVPGTYSCLQAANNAGNTQTLGDKFTGCMVEVRNMPAGAASGDAYAMHRSALTVPAFSYAGACSVTISEVTSRVKGSIACAGMVQTVLEGTARNPVSNSVTADASGEFFCDLQKQ